MIENTLAEYVSGITYSNIQPGDIHLIKRNILDSYAGICASLQDREMIRKFERLSSQTSPEQGLAVWGINRAAATPDAIFMNAILGRRSDLLNTYMSPNRMGGSHPSDNVSVILSLADRLGKTGREVITSTYIAYLLSCAFADYFNPEATGYDHDAQALFYLPLVMGSMTGLSVPQMTQAQRIAGMFGLSINQAAVGNVTDWKHCTFASCALRALHAVKMALAGFEGPGEIYEGEAGINHFFTHGECILQPLPDLQSIIFKQWPALVFCQTPIDVACNIAGKIENPANIERVVVHTHHKTMEEAVQESPELPVSRAGRTHSLTYCVAVALVKKTVAFQHFNDDFLNKEPIVADIISRIEIIEDAAMTQAFPEKAPCRIMVTLQSGVVIEGFRDFPHGDPHDPFTDGEIEEKARRYLVDLAGREKADEIIGRIWTLEKESSIAWLIDPLRQSVLEKSIGGERI